MQVQMPDPPLSLTAPLDQDSDAVLTPPPTPPHATANADNASSSNTTFIQRPLHALVRSKNRSYTSPHLIQPQDQSLFPVSDSFAMRRQQHNAANFQHVRSAAGRLLHTTRKAVSFSEGVEPATAERMTDTDVFLGGSCNPTTWRRDVAIPLLEDAHVKYFNPQVDEWYEELVQIETRAKETAKVLLMVIDNATRTMVSINESVEYICRGRRVVLVVDDILPGTVLEGEVVAPDELADLNGARECLRNLARKKQVRVFANVHDAITGTIRWVLDDHLATCDPEMPRLRKRSSIILNKWSGQIKPRRNTSRSASSTAVLSVVSKQSQDENGTLKSKAKSDSHLSAESIVQHLGCKLYGSYTGGSIYLGGNVDSTCWREKVAIPLLQKAGIPFYIPYLDYLTFEMSRQPGKPHISIGDRWKEIEAEKERAEVRLLLGVHTEVARNG